jgi:hypothetical protein
MTGKMLLARGPVSVAPVVPGARAFASWIGVEFVFVSAECARLAHDQNSDRKMTKKGSRYINTTKSSEKLALLVTNWSFFVRL